MTVVDGTDAVLGRMASVCAKKLLQGEEVRIINAEKALITGRPASTNEKYIRLRQIGSPQHGPFYPRRPDGIVRRAVRGMLPKTKKGRAAMKRLRVEIGNPEDEKGDRVAVREIRTGYITTGKLAKQLGWQG